jgi:hypothetical protein
MKQALLAAACWLCATHADASSGASTPIDAGTFIDSLGVNVHLNYKDTSYRTASKVAEDLAFLGVRHLRQGFPFTWGADRKQLADHVLMARRGYKFDFVVEAGRTFSPDALIARADEIEAAAPGSIEAVEGFNEINNWPVTFHGATGTDAALAAMSTLYAAVHADPHLAGVPVYDMTGAPPAASLSGRADAANQHPYPHNGRPPQIAFDEPPNRPKVVTEIGNFSLPATWPEGKPWWEGHTMLGIDERSQAKSLLLAYFDAAEAGVSRTYLYELLDEKPDPANRQPEDHFGLFRADHSPKPSAIAIHNLTSFLSLPTGAGMVAPVSATGISIKGAPAGVHKLLLRKAPHTWVLALWNEAVFWEWTGPKAFPVDAAPTPVTVGAPSRVKSLIVYDCLTGQSEQLPVKNGRASVPVRDYPLLFAITD